MPNFPNLSRLLTILSLAISANVWGQITSSPSLLFLGNVPINTDSAPRTLTITNSGTASAFLASNQFVAPTNYRIVGGTCNVSGQTLTAGQSCTLSMLFQGLSLDYGPYRTANFFTSTLAAATIASNITPLNVPIQTINFGLVSGSSAGVFSTVAVTFPFSPRLLSSSYYSSSGVQLAAESCRAVAGAPNSCTASFVYRPSGLTPLNESIFLVVDSQQIIQVDAVGTYLPAAVPPFTITPAAVQFPKTLRGASSSQVLTIKNTSAASATILSVGDDFLWGRYSNNSTDFRSSATTCAGATLAPAASCTITVEFAPIDAGEDTGTVQIVSAQGNVQASVTGYGVISLTPLASNPSAVNFGRWSPSFAPKIPIAAIRLSNPTNFSITASSYQFRNTATNFSIDQSGCGPNYSNQLASQASCVVNVSYNKGGPASDIANVLIIKSDLGLLEIPLSIDFAATPNPISLTSVDVDPLTINTPTLSPLVTVKNNATSTANIYGLLFGTLTQPVDFRTFSAVTRGAGGTCPVAGASFALAAGQSCTLALEVSASVKSDLIGNAVYVASDVGSVFGEITANSTTPGARALIANPTTINFGARAPNTYFQSYSSTTLTNPNNFIATVRALAGSQPNLFQLRGTEYSSVTGVCAQTYLGDGTYGFLVPANASCTALISHNSVNAPPPAASSTFYLDSDVGATALTILSEQIATQALQLNTTNIQFAAVVKGSQASATISLRNNGASSITVVDRFVGSDTALSIAPGGSCGNTIPFSISPGVTCTLKLSFLVPSSFSNQSYSGSFNLFSTGGPAQGTYSGYVITNPVPLSADKTSVDFDRVLYSVAPPSQIIKITNPGNSSLSVFSLSVTDGFDISNIAAGSCSRYNSLEPGTCNLTVSPYSSGGAFGEILGNLTYSTSGGSIVVPLRAIVVRPPTLTGDGNSLISSKSGESIPGVITVTNADTLPSVLQAVTISDPQFRLVGGTCGYAQNYSIPASSSCTLLVVFRPATNQSVNNSSYSSLSVLTANGSGQINLIGFVSSTLALVAPSKINVPQDIWVESEPIALNGLSGNGTGTVLGGEASLGCTGVYSSASFAARTDTTLCLRVKSATADNASTTVSFSVSVSGSTPSNNTGSFTAITGQSLLPHYYQTILGRAPDAAGRSYWGAELWRMMQSRADQIEGYRVVAFGFFGSAEYVAKNRADRDYISDLYKTFFNRTPAVAEIDGWMAYLPTVGRDGLLHHFIHSAEFDIFMRDRLGINGNARAETFAAVDFYRGFFRRLPDPTGLAGWVGEYRKAQCEPETTKAASVAATARSISNGFLNSPEYKARATTNAQFVNDLYSAFLRRGADLGGFNGWKAALDNGSQTRAQLMEGFIGSPEFGSRIGQVTAAACGL